MFNEIFHLRAIKTENANFIYYPEKPLEMINCAYRLQLNIRKLHSWSIHGQMSLMFDFRNDEKPNNLSVFNEPFEVFKIKFILHQVGLA